MKVGIIGLPMSGKTSLFRLLAGGSGEGVHRGRAELRQTQVRDPRLDRLAADYQPKKITPAVIDFLDFPPLPSAAPGGGERRSCADLLAPAREAGALVVVVRAFESATVPPLSGRVDPVADLQEVIEELRLADVEVAQRRLERIDASVTKKRGDDRKALEEERETLARACECLESGQSLDELELSPPEEKRLRGFQFLSAKPRLVVENVSEGVEPRITEGIPVPVALEKEVSELDDDDRALFVEEYGLGEPARDRVIREIYLRAGLISFLTAGDPEVRAWTVAQGTTAVEAAGAIHTDMARGFIRAEVVSFRDYERDGGMAGAKEHGHFRLEGKEYVVQDGDIVLFRFNV